jgi:hypothetical protein
MEASLAENIATSTPVATEATTGQTETVPRPLTAPRTRPYAGSMELHVPPELAAKLNRLARKAPDAMQSS